jgi:hypothetical protein
MIDNPLPTSPPQWEAAVLAFLTQHPNQTFSEVLCGLLMPDKATPGHDRSRSSREVDLDLEMKLKLKYSPLVREAIKSLSNDFCIYIDGDKYSAL